MGGRVGVRQEAPSKLAEHPTTHWCFMGARLHGATGILTMAYCHRGTYPEFPAVDADLGLGIWACSHVAGKYASLGLLGPPVCSVSGCTRTVHKWTFCLPGFSKYTQ